MGVKFLLDTHVLLWLLADPSRVPDQVRDQLSDPARTLLVSSVSGLEIATKVRLGKLSAPLLPATLSADVERIGASVLAIGLDHAVLAGSMSWEHRDPFDRLLVAQTRIENCVLVTVDRAINLLPDLRTLTW